MHHFKVCSSVFLLYSQGCASISISRTFSSPQKEGPPHSHEQFAHCFLISSINILSDFVNLPFPDSTCKWSNTVYISALFWPASSLNSFSVHPRCSLYLKFVPFSTWLIIVWLYHILFTHSSLDCFYFLAVMTDAPYGLSCVNFWVNICFQFSWENWNCLVIW